LTGSWAVHGATGVDQDLISHPHRPPPCLPIAALVQFPHYTGPAFLQTDCLTVPIPPHLFEWVMGDGKGLSRQQLPLQLQYAMTIHKSQGQTLAQNVVDLGKAERATGCSYVALSNQWLSKATIDWEKQAITGKAQRRRTIKKSSSNHSTSISARSLIDYSFFNNLHSKASIYNSRAH